MESNADEEVKLWVFGMDEEAKMKRLQNLVSVVINKDLPLLQSAIRVGLDINEWYNSSPDAAKAVSQPNMYSRRIRNRMLHVSSKDHMQVLHLYISYRWTEGVRELLQAGADVNAYDYRVSPPHSETDTSFTPLMHACFHVTVPIVKLLLENGADPLARDPMSGKSPVSLAFSFSSYSVLKLLLDSGATMTASDTKSLSLQTAVEMFINPLVKVTNMRQYSTEELELKIEEVKVMALKMMELLLENEVDPNIASTTDYLPPLHQCAEGARGDLRAMEVLVSYGADVDLLSKGTYYHEFTHLTPLLSAVTGDDPLPAVSWLMRHGANVDEKVQRWQRGRAVGDPVSILTVALENGLEQIASLLIRSGCEVTHENVEALKNLKSELNELNNSNYNETGQHVPEILSSVKNIDETLSFLNEPHDLKWIVRKILRSELQVKQERAINALPLPRALKEFIMCYDL